ncbi:hypothetical protein [Actinomadura madurae]|uniref:hypothetical protein n=1 Tax=Actinomadura madurae TaxID=1993 RepID=UPI0020D25D1C|nr:hypothetical protein [Actinomadura madurae]MCP9979153.1 hypothetical protein [Actinomadura madurae]
MDDVAPERVPAELAEHPDRLRWNAKYADAEPDGGGRRRPRIRWRSGRCRWSCRTAGCSTSRPGRPGAPCRPPRRDAP